MCGTVNTSVRPSNGSLAHPGCGPGGGFTGNLGFIGREGVQRVLSLVVLCRSREVAWLRERNWVGRLACEGYQLEEEDLAVGLGPIVELDITRPRRK